VAKVAVMVVVVVGGGYGGRKGLGRGKQGVSLFQPASA